MIVRLVVLTVAGVSTPKVMSGSYITSYIDMIPLRSISGTSVQGTLISVDDCTVALMFCGGLVGAGLVNNPELTRMSILYKAITQRQMHV